MNKREKWTESEIEELPAGEQDYFERKSGLLFQNRGEFLDTIAKAISAFSNSGGGSLVLGVTDNGIPDGLPSLVGNASIKDWLEQKIPNLVDYPISDFRVHQVIRKDPSHIPTNTEIIVVDVGDSALAPHQSSRDKTYYYRSAGRSERAPHFYLELLHQRLTNPTLEVSLENLALIDSYNLDGNIFIEAKMEFIIKNTGRIAAYKWGIFIRTINNVPDNRENDYFLGTQNFPLKKSRDRNLRLDDTILPGGALRESKDIGFILRPSSLHSSLETEAEQVIGNISIGLQLATETSPGQLVSIGLHPFVNISETISYIKQHIESKPPTAS